MTILSFQMPNGFYEEKKSYRNLYISFAPCVHLWLISLYFTLRT